MRVTKLINISEIIVDKYSISPKTLALVDYIRNEEGNHIGVCILLPPIKVQKLENGQYKLKDGRHRVTAFKLLGIKMITAKFYDSDKND